MKIIYCGANEFRNKPGFHSENPSPEELKYAVILAETRGHDAVYAHYNNVISLEFKKQVRLEEEEAANIAF